MQEQREPGTFIKLLLVGPPGSGKTTIVNRLMQANSYTKAERDACTRTVHANTVDSMNLLMGRLLELDELEMPADLAAMYDSFQVHPCAVAREVTCELATAMKQMWEHPATQWAFERKDKLNLGSLDDSACFFFNDLDRIACR